MNGASQQNNNSRTLAQYKRKMPVASQAFFKLNSVKINLIADLSGS